MNWLLWPPVCDLITVESFAEKTGQSKYTRYQTPNENASDTRSRRSQQLIEYEKVFPVALIFTKYFILHSCEHKV